MKSKNKNKKIIYLLIVVVVIAIILLVFSYFYSAITQKIIENSIKSIEEVTKHDEISITSNLKQRWSYAEGIAREISEMQLTSSDELLEQINIKAKTLNPIDMFLVSSDGEFYNSNFSITNVSESNDPLFNLYKNSDTRFAYRIKNPSTSQDAPTEVLAIGSKIEPFVVDNKTFEYVVCYYSTDLLVGDLEIDLYNGRGSSIVIDRNGNYIVSIHRDKDFLEINNFFEAIGEELFKSDVSIDEIKEKMANQEHFNIQYSLKGITFIMVFSPVKNLNWYFVESIPRAIFEDQSRDIINIFSILISFILIAIITVTVLIFRNTSQRKLMNLESTHRKELESALNAAEQANRAKTTFLNNMSHDIRTPMNAIIGFTNLANLHLNDVAQTRDYLNKISQSSNHLLSLINDVLDMSRIESGKVSIEEKEENFAEIIHSLSNIIQADIFAKKLNFNIDTINVNNEFIYCDKLRLNQILLNLLSNSIKFTPEGGTISLLVTQKEGSTPDEAVFEFKIKDTGIGISDDFLNILFEPFTRERNSTVSGIQGTGLGMAIVKSLIDMMGGTIDVKSNVGSGTEFTITLTFKLPKNKELSLPYKNLENSNALIISNDKNTYLSISGMLNTLKINSSFATSKEDALTLIKELSEKNNTFSILFIEWEIKDENGIQIATDIKKLINNDIPIILISAYDFSAIRSDAVNAGITDFINKPIFMSDLINILDKHYNVDNVETAPKEEIDFSNKRILLVEDNFMNREIATEYLTDFGFLIESAENGKIAYEMIKNSTKGYYNLVLMDVQMPVMNGYEATKAIRQLEDKDLANIPIVAMTANVFEEDKNLVQECGMDGFLAKPINISELIQVLKKFLNVSL